MVSSSSRMMWIILRLNAEAAGGPRALNRTRQERIERCVPARRLKLLPGLFVICLDKYMRYGVYTNNGICVRGHCGAEPPRDIEPPGLVRTVGRRDRAPASHDAADCLK